MNRVCSIFAQLLQLFPRDKFQQAVDQHDGERHARGFTCWGQFAAMLFCQLGQAKSLREICNGLMAIEGKLKHLGIGKAPNKSTLAYANEHRPWRCTRPYSSNCWKSVTAWRKAKRSSASRTSY